MTGAADRSGCDTYCATTRHACQYHQGVEDGRDEERVAVVAFLRFWPVRHLNISEAADAIERGEHRG